MKTYHRFLLVFSSALSLSLFAEETVPAKATASAVIPPQLYFSPRDHVDEKLITLIDNEKEDIRIAVYCLTHRGIIKSLIDARKRGVNVEVVVDPFTVKARCPLKRMAQAGISIFVWDPEPISHEIDKTKKKEKSRKPLMHNKFCVFGKRAVWSGSFNFTSEASVANQENVVILHDSPVVEKYIAEFERVKIEGCSTFTTYLSNESAKKKKKFY